MSSSAAAKVTHVVSAFESTCAGKRKKWTGKVEDAAVSRKTIGSKAFGARGNCGSGEEVELVKQQGEEVEPRKVRKAVPTTAKQCVMTGKQTRGKESKDETRKSTTPSKTPQRREEAGGSSSVVPTKVCSPPEAKEQFAAFGKPKALSVTPNASSASSTSTTGKSVAKAKPASSNGGKALTTAVANKNQVQARGADVDNRGLLQEKSTKPTSRSCHLPDSSNAESSKAANTKCKTAADVVQDKTQGCVVASADLSPDSGKGGAQVSPSTPLREPGLPKKKGERNKGGQLLSDSKAPHGKPAAAAGTVPEELMAVDEKQAHKQTADVVHDEALVAQTSKKHAPSGKEVNLPARPPQQTKPKDPSSAGIPVGKKKKLRPDGNSATAEGNKHRAAIAANTTDHAAKLEKNLQASDKSSGTKTATATSTKTAKVKMKPDGTNDNPTAVASSSNPQSPSATAAAEWSASEVKSGAKASSTTTEKLLHAKTAAPDSCDLSDTTTRELKASRSPGKRSADSTKQPVDSSDKLRDACGDTAPKQQKASKDAPNTPQRSKDYDNTRKDSPPDTNDSKAGSDNDSRATHASPLSCQTGNSKASSPTGKSAVDSDKDRNGVELSASGNPGANCVRRFERYTARRSSSQNSEERAFMGGNSSDEGDSTSGNEDALGREKSGSDGDDDDDEDQAEKEKDSNKPRRRRVGGIFTGSSHSAAVAPAGLASGSTGASSPSGGQLGQQAEEASRSRKKRRYEWMDSDDEDITGSSSEDEQEEMILLASSTAPPAKAAEPPSPTAAPTASPTCAATAIRLHEDVRCISISNISWDVQLSDVKEWLEAYPLEPPLRVVNIVAHPQPKGASNAQLSSSANTTGQRAPPLSATQQRQPAVASALSQNHLALPPGQPPPPPGLPSTSSHQQYLGTMALQPPPPPLPPHLGSAAHYLPPAPPYTLPPDPVPLQPGSTGSGWGDSTRWEGNAASTGSLDHEHDGRSGSSFRKADHPGRAFVEFDSHDTMTHALQLNDALFRGRQLKVGKAFKRSHGDYYMLETPAHYKYYQQLHSGQGGRPERRFRPPKVDGGYNWCRG